MAVASVEKLSDALFPAIWELSVKLLDPCPLMTINFTQNFNSIESSELASKIETTKLPVLELTPYKDT